MLAEQPYSVVVSDLRMPGMDGIELFITMARQLPCVGRVLLSGTAEADATMRAIPIAHRFLCKPSDRRSLVETCRALHGYGATAMVAGGIVGLGIDGEAVAAARAALTNRSALHTIVASQPALVAALLHSVGSEFLGSPTAVATIDEALDVIGESGFARLLGSGILQVVDAERNAPLACFVANARQRAAQVAADGGSQTAVVAALVADIDRIGSSDVTRWTGMREGGAAATLLGLWGAPGEVVEHVAAFAASLRTRPSVNGCASRRSCPSLA